jgi:hypothetical protein
MASQIAFQNWLFRKYVTWWQKAMFCHLAFHRHRLTPYAFRLIFADERL